MNDRMYAHPATQSNLRRLEELGYALAGPAVGPLAWGEGEGPGRMLEPDEILARAGRALEAQTLAGRRVVVTAGGTREPIDPVRYVGNRSSGRMGYALAASAWRRGADVLLVSGPSPLPPPAGVAVHRVETAEEMEGAVAMALPGADALVMAAAVADFRPADVSGTKIKKRDDVADPVISLVRNPDILRELVETRDAASRHQLIVGFAAETGDADGDVLDYAAAKLRRKACDLLVVNHVGQDKVFGEDTNSVVILSRTGSEPQEASGSKSDVAAAVIDRISAELSRVVPPA
jgi:phosphopantothenoylcysteine decarboxylase/phosphopantothenate--cysteine ligase